MSRSEAVVWLMLAIVAAAAVTFLAVPAADVLVGEAWSVFATAVP